MTSPYDYYQYWINCDDRDVGKLLKTFTFLPLRKIEYFASLEGADIRRAKRALAYEATAIAHGHTAAYDAKVESGAMFGDKESVAGSNLIYVTSEELEQGMGILDLLVHAKLFNTRTKARNVLRQGGVYINGIRIKSPDTYISTDHINERTKDIRIKVGKKKYRRIVVE